MRIERRDSFWEYREILKELMAGRRPGLAGEGGSDYQPDKGPLPLNERLIQTIWAQGLIQPTGMRVADGRPLRVLDAGRWNGSAGPDFMGAKLMIGGESVKGDVEIHLKASDWEGHGHHRDLDYNGVVLHVVLESGDGKDRDVLHNGNEIPRLAIESYIFPDLETLSRSLSLDDLQYTQPTGLGRCHQLMTELDPEVVADFLDRAGDERLVAKMQRLEEQARQADLEQVFYQAVMMALGSGPSKTLYYLLAKRTPPREMMDFVRDLPRPEWITGLEALLMHVAGLAPDEEGLADAPDDARRRAGRLRELWRGFEQYWNDRLIPPTRRWYQGHRPTNFPTRRLSAVAVLLARAMERGKEPLADLTDHIRQGMASLEGAAPARRKHPLLVELIRWFRVGGEGHFWGNHYSFTAKPAGRVMDLIGEGTALSLVLNALLPAALLVARREGDGALAEAAHRLFGLVPPLQPNHITEFMTRRLFGEDEKSIKLINTERRRQALFQIFYHCCHGEERHCDTCYYLECQARGEVKKSE